MEFFACISFIIGPFKNNGIVEFGNFCVWQDGIQKLLGFCVLPWQFWETTFVGWDFGRYIILYLPVDLIW